NFKNVRRVFNPEVMKRVKTYEWDKEVIPGVTAIGTPGHTPGHTSFVIVSGPDSVYVQSDVTQCHSSSYVIPIGTLSTIRMVRRQRLPDAWSTTCWWWKSCGFRASTTRSPRWRMSRNTARAIARFRLSGILQFSQSMLLLGPWWKYPPGAEFAHA